MTDKEANMTPPQCSPGTEHELAARLADYKDKQFGNWSCATLSLRWHELDEIITALRAGVAQPPPRCDRCGSSGDVFTLCAGCQSPVSSADQREKTLADYTDAEIRAELHHRTMEFLGCPTRGVSVSSTEGKTYE